MYFDININLIPHLLLCVGDDGDVGDVRDDGDVDGRGGVGDVSFSL